MILVRIPHRSLLLLLLLILPDNANDVFRGINALSYIRFIICTPFTSPVCSGEGIVL